MTVEKGEPLDAAELTILDERARVARAWLADFAPERYRVAVQESLPEDLSTLTEAQRIVLRELADAAETAGREGASQSGDAWQDRIFQAAQTRGVSSGDAFGAIYAAFLGRANGPRAGWLLASLDLGFVVQRLREAAAQGIAA